MWLIDPQNAVTIIRCAIVILIIGILLAAIGSLMLLFGYRVN